MAIHEHTAKGQLFTELDLQTLNKHGAHATLLRLREVAHEELAELRNTLCDLNPADTNLSVIYARVTAEIDSANSLIQLIDTTLNQLEAN